VDETIDRMSQDETDLQEIHVEMLVDSHRSPITHKTSELKTSEPTKPWYVDAIMDRFDFEDISLRKATLDPTPNDQEKDGNSPNTHEYNLESSSSSSSQTEMVSEFTSHVLTSEGEK
jgi:hypothetical protein